MQLSMTARATSIRKRIQGLQGDCITSEIEDREYQHEKRHGDEDEFQCRDAAMIELSASLHQLHILGDRHRDARRLAPAVVEGGVAIERDRCGDQLATLFAA